MALTIVSSISQLGAHKAFLELKGKYAYTLSYYADKIYVTDISNAAAPVTVGTLTDVSLDGVYNVFIRGKYLYTASSLANSFGVIDISNPASPVIAGSLTDATNLASIGSITVRGKYAYYASGGTHDAVGVIDISNAAAPTFVSYVRPFDEPVLGNIRGKYIYVTTHPLDALKCFDISNPAAVTEVGSVTGTALDGAHHIQTVNKYAYVANLGSATTPYLTAVDISNPTAPSVVGNSPNAGFAISFLRVQGKYAYVARDNDYVYAVDISNPASPVQTSSVTDAVVLDYAMGIDIQGKYAYVSANDKFVVIDISSP